MRRNKMTGPIPGAGRPEKNKSLDAILNVRISKEAQKALRRLVPERMQRGNYIAKLILEQENNDLI